MEFNVGDRVRCTRNVDGFDTKGKAGTIKKTNMLFVGVDFDEDVEGWGDTGLGIKEGHGVSVKYEDLELIEENADTFTLGDLKVGYLVELRDGSGNMVMEATEGKVLIEEYNGYYLELNAYNNNLNYYGDSDYDIIKVYGFSKYKSKALKFTTEDRELLWERKEILNGKEKEYLSSYIKPFKDRVKNIKKWYDNNSDKYLISAEYKDGSFPTNFPFLEEKMYKNMEVDRAYTLEELGL